MLTLNTFHEIGKSYFPDGTQKLLDVDIDVIGADVGMANTICWHYENDEECMTLFYLVKHIRSVRGENADICLHLKFIPNARMDRIKNPAQEVFTLKYFCEFINSLKFTSVHVLDPHSDVCLALLDRVSVADVGMYIGYALRRTFDYFADETPEDHVIIYFPDAGAYRRYKDIPCLSKFQKIYGNKVRNWSTGKIEGLRIVDQNATLLEGEHVFEGKTILMVDDIISHGGTFYYSARQLKACGAKEIYAYATHTENSVLDKENGMFIKCLEDGTVRELITTDSIFSGSHDKIVVI